MAMNTDDEELQGWLWSPTGNQVALVFEAKAPFTNSATNRQGRVSLYGRQIATFHPSQHLVCLDGVNPGSVVAHGQTIQEAQDRFRDEVTYILSDIDSSCGSSIEMFRKEVANFMEQTDVSLADKWNELAEAQISAETQKIHDSIAIHENVPMTWEAEEVRTMMAAASG